MKGEECSVYAVLYAICSIFGGNLKSSPVTKPDLTKIFQRPKSLREYILRSQHLTLS